MVLWFYMQIYLVCRIFESSKGLIFCLFLTTDVTKVFQNYIYFVPMNSFINN